MNKSEFVDFISKTNNCSKLNADNAINIFTSSVIEVLGSGKDLSLTGFGNFIVKKVEPRMGRNPKTGESMKIKAYNQPKFKVGKNLKDAVNK